MSAINASTRVYRDAVTLSAVGKRQLFKALARALLANTHSPAALEAVATTLKHDLYEVVGQARGQRHPLIGDNNDRAAA